MQVAERRVEKGTEDDCPRRPRSIVAELALLFVSIVLVVIEQCRNNLSDNIANPPEKASTDHLRENWPCLQVALVPMDESISPIFRCSCR